MKGADPQTFKVLNYTFAIDKNSVFTITGKVPNADINSFEILDDGKKLLWYTSEGIPKYSFHGYAKDKNNVYYHNYEGKPKVIRPADLKTFSSLNDGYFARDKNHIYGNGKIIKNADTKSWRTLTKLNSLYSMDSGRVFYGFWEVVAVDYDSFELVVPDVKYLKYQLAKDKNNFYRNGEIITTERFNEWNKKNSK